MQKGEIQKRKGTQAVDQGDDEHTCYQGELLAACDVGEVTATGGPCPIVVIYHRHSKRAAIMHISGEDAENGGDAYVEMLALLDDVDSSFPRTSRCVICLDCVPMPGSQPEEEEAEQEDIRMAYAKSIKDYLIEDGFPKAKILTKGQEKTIYLDTSTGLLRVVDFEDKELLSVNL